MQWEAMLSNGVRDSFRGVLVWLYERKALLLAAAFVALCNFYYFDIRYFSALHPGLCQPPEPVWSRFNNSPDAVALPRAFLFLLLAVAMFAVYRGGRSYPSFWRFVFPRLYEWFMTLPRVRPIALSTSLTLFALGLSSMAAMVAACS
jgi:hypothetical protein